MNDELLKDERELNCRGVRITVYRVFRIQYIDTNTLTRIRIYIIYSLYIHRDKCLHVHTLVTEKKCSSIYSLKKYTFMYFKLIWYKENIK